MKILVTGGTGMVGSAFCDIDTDHELIMVGSKSFDLRDPNAAANLLTACEPEAIIHLAARVGGVKGNMERVGDFFHDNILINTNVLRSALHFNQEHPSRKPIKVLSLLSTCIYPDKVEYPLTVNQIHNGPPHESNFGYAYAKRMLDIHTKAINSQYGYKWITAVPNNIYGKNDNFSLEHSHVVPALIRKIHNAKLNGDKVVLWGDGSPLREFTYSEDIANILLWMIENYDDQTPLNIGNTIEFCIKDVAENICKIFDYPFEKIVWDHSQPSGQYKKPSSNRRLKELNKNVRYINLWDGLKSTCDWYLKNYPNVRGVDDDRK